MTGGARRAARRIGIALGTLGLAALGAEAGLRIVGYEPLRTLRSARAQAHELFLRPAEDPRLVYELRPSTQGRAFDCEVEVNSHGFRDREHPVEKPAGVRRIVVLGDSITFGNGLAVEETYPEQIEAMLAQRGLRVEVLNLGVTGYDTMQEAAFLELRGMAFQPDLVLVGYCMNDAGTQSVELGHLLRAERFKSPIYASRVVQWVHQRLERHRLERGFYDLNRDDRYAALHRGQIAELDDDPELLATMDELRRLLDASERAVPGYHPLPWYASRAHVGRLRRSFEALAAVAARGGVPVLVAVLPYLRDGPWGRELDLAYDLVEREARRAGLAVLQLRDPVRAAGMSTLQVTTDDTIHYNAQGHRLLAELVTEHLAATFLPSW